jgi:hypothetical protein
VIITIKKKQKTPRNPQKSSKIHKKTFQNTLKKTFKFKETLKNRRKPLKNLSTGFSKFTF